MSDSQTGMPGEALLEAAEKEIGKGNLREGAGLVWSATVEALAAVAGRYGMSCSTREEAVEVVNYLDDFAASYLSDAPYSYRNLMAFSVAETYLEHYADLSELEGTEFEWAPDEYVVHLNSVRRLLKSINEHANGSPAQ